MQPWQREIMEAQHKKSGVSNRHCFFHGWLASSAAKLHRRRGTFQVIPRNSSLNTAYQDCLGLNLNTAHLEKYSSAYLYNGDLKT
jgi:hypothetical protein